MDFRTSFKICAAGLAVQRTKLDTTISNLVNIDTTRTPEGGPYLKRSVAVANRSLPEPFHSVLREELRLVEVSEIRSDQRAIKTVYDPSHPDANAQGFVTMPDINVMQEMANMMVVNRAFEAITAAFDASKQMASKAMELGRQ